MRILAANRVGAELIVAFLIVFGVGALLVWALITYAAQAPEEWGRAVAEVGIVVVAFVIFACGLIAYSAYRTAKRILKHAGTRGRSI